jgi:hypothetical protein
MVGDSHDQRKEYFTVLWAEILTLISKQTSIFPAFFKGKCCFAEEFTVVNKCTV